MVVKDVTTVEEAVAVLRGDCGNAGGGVEKQQFLL